MQRSSLTPALPPAAAAALETEYEDVLALWTDLEAGLSLMLKHPVQTQDFPGKVRQLDRWLQELMAHDTDAALYLMFQLASTSSVGYSASHALVCATLCEIMARELSLPARERNALVRAALTMNIGMTELQDQLAVQRERPSSSQQEAIQQHPHWGQSILEQLNILDDLWLDVVAHHHEPLTKQTDLSALSDVQRLQHILSMIDRYAAMISPRKSREGRSVTDSMRELLGKHLDARDPVGYALVRAVGLCPPGTFVRLDNGETAVVLRRSEQSNLPVVASLLDRNGELLPEPRVHNTSTGKPHLQSALPRSAVSVELDHRMMVRLGLYAATSTQVSWATLAQQPVQE